MDFSEKTSRANPFAKANAISKLFFVWLLPLFRQGFRRDLNLDDIYDTLPADVSQPLGDQLEKYIRNLY